MIRPVGERISSVDQVRDDVNNILNVDWAPEFVAEKLGELSCFQSPHNELQEEEPRNWKGGLRAIDEA